MTESVLTTSTLPPEVRPAEGERGFYIVWAGQLVSAAGSALMAFALGVWAFQHSGSVLDYALAIVCGTVPRIVVAPWIGPLLARSEPRRVMLAAETASWLCASALLVMLLHGALALWHVYALGAVSAVALSFQSVAYQVLVAELVPPERLARANGFVQLAGALSQLAAPAAAGALMGVIGLAGVASIDMASFVAAIVAVLFAGRHVAGAARTAALVAEPGPEQALAGARLLRRHGRMRALLAYGAVQQSMVGMVLILVTPVVLSSWSSAVLGSLLTMGGLGALVGAVLMSVLPVDRLIATMRVFGLVLGLAEVLAGWTRNLYLLYACGFAVMVCMSVVGAAEQTLWQRKVPPAERGHIFSLRQAFGAATGPVAAIAAGLLSDRLFSPWLTPGGALADSLGLWFGVGPGRGAALLVCVVGVVSAVSTVVALSHPRLRTLERELPDAAS